MVRFCLILNHQWPVKVPGIIMPSLSAIRPIKRAALSDNNMWRKLSHRYVTLGRKKSDIDKKTNVPQVQTPAIEAQNCNKRSFNYATVSTGRDESNGPAAISETDAQRLRRRAKLLDRWGFLIGLIPMYVSVPVFINILLLTLITALAISPTLFLRWLLYVAVWSLAWGSLSRHTKGWGTISSVVLLLGFVRSWEPASPSSIDATKEMLSSFYHRTRNQRPPHQCPVRSPSFSGGLKSEGENENNVFFGHHIAIPCHAPRIILKDLLVSDRTPWPLSCNCYCRVLRFWGLFYLLLIFQTSSAACRHPFKSLRFYHQ